MLTYNTLMKAAAQEDKPHHFGESSMPSTPSLLERNIRLSLADLSNFVFRLSNLVGPYQPVSDYRVAAGLLFKRYNDGTTRTLIAHRNTVPYIRIGYHADIHRSSYTEICVTNEVVRELVERRIVEGTAHFGYTDPHELILSKGGKRRVAEEWFDVDIYDMLSAGATLSLDTAKLSW